MNKTSTILVEKSSLNDIPMMIKINNQQLLSNKKSLRNEEIEASGFLIIPYTEEMIHFYVSSEKYFSLSARFNNQIVGYAICCDLNEEKDLLHYIKKTSAECSIVETSNVLYLNQIAKVDGKKGVGKKLMAAILDYAIRDHYRYIVCQIVHAPLCNRASIQFHKNFGFQPIAEMIRNDGVTAGIYLKKLSDT